MPCKFPSRWSYKPLAGAVSESAASGYPLVQGMSSIEVSGHLMVISVVCIEKVSERPKPEGQDFYFKVRNVLKD